MRQIRKRLLKQILALLLIVCLVMGTVPVSLAVDVDDESPAVSEEIVEESAEEVESPALEEGSVLEDQAEASEKCKAVDEAAEPVEEPPEETATLPLDEPNEQAEDGSEMNVTGLDELEFVSASIDETTEPVPVNEQSPADEEEAEDKSLREVRVPTEVQNENSEYAIVLGPDGVTSEYAILDETTHTVGSHIVTRTFVLRFQDTSFTVTNNTGGPIRSSDRKMVNADGAFISYGSFTKDGTRDATYLDNTLGVKYTDASRLTAGGYTEFDLDSSMFFYIYFIGNTTIDLDYAVLIEITPNGAISETGMARLGLDEQINRVTGENTDNWYQSGDRYNGRTTSKDGFWNDMQPILAEAQSVYSNTGATVEELRTATGNLSAAIDMLIPVSRVNATELYEAIQEYNLYDEVYYTEDTWAPFAAALMEAQALLASLYNSDGSYTEVNTAACQPEVNATVQALEDAFAGLMSTSAEDSFNYYALLYRRTVEWLLGQTDLNESEYTADTWAVWIQARDTLAACAADGCGTTMKIRAYLQALSAANTAYYALESREESVTVHVRVADTFSLIYPSFGLADADTITYDDDVTLAEDKTVDGLMNAMGFNKTQLALNETYAPAYYVYINGELAVDRSKTSVGEWRGETNGKPQLRDGDDIVIAVVDPPAYYYYISRIPNAGYDTYYEYLSLLHIEDEDRVIEAEAGQPFELSVTKTTAAAEVNTRTDPASGVDVFLSTAQGNAVTAKRAPAKEKLDVQTDENGTAAISIYAEGWYRLAIADVTPQTSGSLDVYGNSKGGAYDNLAAGDYVLVHVLPSQNDGAVRDSLQAELDEIYGSHEEDFYTAQQWEQLTLIYLEASQAVAESVLLGDAYSSQKAAVRQMTSLINSVINEHGRQRSEISWYLSHLPDDADAFTDYYTERFENLRTLIDSLSSYMQGQMTQGQQAKYDRLLKTYGRYNGTLPEGKKYKVFFDVTGEKDSLYAITSISNHQYPSQTVISDQTMFSSLNIAPIEVIPGASVGVGFYDSDVTDQYDWPEVQITGVTIEGAKDWNCNVFEAFRPSYAEGEYRYSRCDLGLIMPDNDVTVHIVIGDVGAAGDDQPVDLNTFRREALQQLQEVFDTYDEEKYNAYDASVWNAIVSIKHDGDEAIGSAETEEDMNHALQDAMSAMFSVGRDTTYAMRAEGITLPEYGDPVGRVFISLENTTYPEGNTAFESYYPFEEENIFFAGWYDLCENDTMMTALLKALTINGLSWLGTGGVGYDITYLSTVYVDVNSNGVLDDNEPSLAEFDGGTEAGWMGTLNDWFVNYGFDQFSCAEGEIWNGDIISVKYTSAGLGSDLGGSFGNSDTSLKELMITGATLDPSFASNTRIYTAIVSGGVGSIKVTPTANNKNYLVKTFLNRYDSDEAFFRRTQSIPVRAGDVVYVGCGEYSWPSMNKQEAQAIYYSGTKYTLYIVENNAASIDKKTELLPTESDMIYSNYLDYKTQINELYERYNELTESEKQEMDFGEKLKNLHEKVMAFTHVDDVKSMIAGLPEQSLWTEADKPSLQAVLDAYSTLNEAEKLAYMTVREANTIAAIEEYLATAATVLYGDANGDGSVSSKDAMRILQYVVDNSIAIDITAADANGDGNISSKDAMKVLQHVVDPTVPLGKQG